MDMQPVMLASEHLEWEQDGELPLDAAAAVDVGRVGKTLVQLSAWTCTEGEVEGTQAALFEVEFIVVPGRGARLDYAQLTIKLDDPCLKILELGPTEVLAKDPVEKHRTTTGNCGFHLTGGHAPVATGGVNLSRTSNFSRKGKTYPCRVKATAAGLTYAR